jgi:hypothetical protein
MVNRQKSVAESTMVRFAAGDGSLRQSNRRIGQDKRPARQSAVREGRKSTDNRHSASEPASANRRPFFSKQAVLGIAALFFRSFNS